MPSPNQPNGAPSCVYQPIRPLGFWRGSDSSERILVITAWLGTILAGVSLGLASIVFEWSGIPVHFAGVDIYVDLYPPLIFATLWTLWFGFWWGFVPAYLSTLVLALYSGMAPGWAALFAFADPLGLALFAMAYRAIPIPYDLRSLNAILFFVLLSFVGGIFGSTGSFIWISTSTVSINQVLPIWEGWWLGAFLQNLLVVAPLLLLISPTIARWRTFRSWGQLGEQSAKRHVLMGGSGILAGVLLFLYLSVHLNVMHFDAISADGSEAGMRKAAHALVESTHALYWVMASIVLFASYFGYQLFEHWTSSIRRAARELAVANADLIRARDLAEEAARAKSTFLATMSHEIRTPMNGVISLAEILDQTTLDSEQHGMVRVLRDSANALLTVINDILDFSKIEAGKLDLEFIPFSLVEMVESVANLLSHRAEENGLNLSVWVDPSLTDRRCGDPMRLRQILINLAGNAIKFTQTGSVEIEVAPADDGSVHFSVTDTGVGLSDEQQAHLFQPFVQVDTSTSRKFGGTGLGLSISRRLVELMGGTIGLQSRLGEGATFWFTVPLACQVGHEQPVCPDMRGMRVTVIDGSRPEGTALWRYLEWAGVTLTSVPVGPQALPFLRSLSDQYDGPDVVLIDAASHADGLELGSAILTDTQIASTKVILMASLSQVSTLTEAQRNGFFAALTRPVQRQRLWRTVAAAMRRSQLEDAFQIQPNAGVARYLPPTLEEAREAGAAILVAEDNPTNQLVIGKVLERLGYAAVLVSNGAEALDMLGRERFGLLITDCHMPTMDGFELARRIRDGSTQHARSMPILALTADALKGTEEICHAAGMDDYLSKPVETSRLDAAILRWLPQASRLRQPMLDDTTQRPRSHVVPQASLASRPVAESRPVLDRERVSFLFDGFSEEAIEMLDMLVQSVSTLMDQMRGSLSNQDAVGAARHAHSAAGAANNAGASALGGLLSAMELQLKRGELDQARLGLVDATAAFDRLKAEIASLKLSEQTNG
ncbi:MAG TPA: ATP-binding protein [Candidatus Sulfotelmatobacter sp.]|nr:ATP-binding protein [Candidatus Sulfotelmatobacter sp.]